MTSPDPPNKVLVVSKLFRVNNVVYSKFKSHLLGVGSGSQENKMELGSEKLSMIPIGGGVSVEFCDERWKKDSEETLECCVREGAQKLPAGSYSISRLGELSLGVGGGGDVVMRQSNL